MENKERFLPEISKKDIRKKDAWKFLYVFLNKYFEMNANNRNVTTEFNEYQQTLMAYRALDSEVCNGGFIQLIHNGYGRYIFDSPFSESIKTWGAERTAHIVDKAKEIYNTYKKELEKEKTDDEFSELYKKITEFEPLEDEYYKINDEETEKVRKYVESNMHNFAKII